MGSHACLRAAARPVLALLALLAAPLGSAGPARAGAWCEAPPTGGPVSLVVLASPARVQALARSLSHLEVLRRSPETVVFADGRVVTSDVEKAGAHLNALGWASRPIDVVASFPARSRAGVRRRG